MELTSRYHRLVDRLKKPKRSGKKPERLQHESSSPQSGLVAAPPPSMPETYDPWIESEKILRKDLETKKLLENATEILRSNGLSFGSSTAQNHQQLCSFLEDGAQKLDESKWRIGDSQTPLERHLTPVFKNVLMVKDLINAAAASSPPAVIACASLTVVFTVSLHPWY